MAGLLQVVRGPRAEDARADDCHMIPHGPLVGCCDGGRYGSAARPGEERAARYAGRLHRPFVSRADRAVLEEEEAAEEAAVAGPGRSPSPESPSRPSRSASPAAVAGAAEAVAAEPR